MCVYPKIIHVLYALIQNEHSCVLKWNEIFNLSGCLSKFKTWFLQYMKFGGSGVYDPIAPFYS